MFEHGDQVEFDWYGSYYCDMVLETVSDNGWDMVKTLTGKVVPVDLCVKLVKE